MYTMVNIGKKNKLPSSVFSVDFELEYGSATIEMHKDSINEKDKAEIVRILFETKTYEILSKKIKSEGRKLKKILRDEGFNNEGSNQLKQAISMLTSNKIYHNLEDSYKIAKDILSKKYVLGWGDELI